MNLIRNNTFYIAGLIGIITALILTVFILFGWRQDISVTQNENRQIFGATYMTMNNPYYQVLDSKLRSEIEERGDVLLTRDAAMDQRRQNEEIEELINAGAKVIFLTPVEWEESEEGLTTAEKAGVPVIVVDAPVQATDKVACSIVSDNYQAGVLCAKHLLKHKDSAKIILLEHITARSGTERIQGFCDTIAWHSGFEVVGTGESDGQIENAMPVMENLLEKCTDADTVMALNDPSAFGAMAAIEGSGLTDSFSVYSVDGSPEAKALIQDNMMTATCAQFPYRMAEKAVDIAYDLLNGKEVQHEIVVPVELITEKNVGLFEQGGWQ